MVRHGKGRARRSFNLRRVRVATGIAAGALAPLDVAVSNLTNVGTDPYRIMSVDFSYALSDLGAASDDGQEFGLAHSDYTAAEIEECIEQASSIDLGNKIAQEHAHRLVRVIGQMGGAHVAGGGLDFNDGRRVKTKLNWRMSTGDSLNLWIRNSSGSVWTTGAFIDVVGDMWIKDGS